MTDRHIDSKVTTITLWHMRSQLTTVKPPLSRLLRYRHHYYPVQLNQVNINDISGWITIILNSCITTASKILFRSSLWARCLRAVKEGGTTLTSEPVSTKKRLCECKSLMINRQLGHWPCEFVAANVWPGSFPNCMAPCISELPRQIWYGTSKGNLWSKIFDAEGQDSMYSGIWTYFAGGDEPSRI